MVGLCWSQALVILDYDGMRELIPIIDMVRSLAVAEGIQTGVVNIKVSVNEDNLGALVLAETLPPQFTPRSKYYATKTIWFLEEITNGESSFLRLILLNSLGIFSPRSVSAHLWIPSVQNHWLVITLTFFVSSLYLYSCLWEYKFERECRYRSSWSFILGALSCRHAFSPALWVRSVGILQDCDCHVAMHFFITYKNVCANDKGFYLGYVYKYSP